jgi:hypothetical protein
MALTFKDFWTTILALGVGGLYWARLQNLSLPFITGNRAAILLLAVLGIGMCILGSGNGFTQGMTAWTIFASGLGILAFGFIVAGLITGTQIWVMLLAGTFLLLWGATTLKHALGY